MLIEQDARRFIIEAVKVDQEMQKMERYLEQRQENVYQNSHYNEKRQQLVNLLSQINSVANINGKGRDDLTDLAILKAAENLSNELLVGQAQSIQTLADKIRQSVRCFRALLRRYSENLDGVDPQLKNNKELVEVLEVYENSWSLGKEHLLDQAKKEQIIKFCMNIEKLCTQNPVFKE